MKRYMLFLLSVGAVLFGVWYVWQYPFSLEYLDVDFNLRYNEACLVLRGIDPFLVWNGSIPSEEYLPWKFSYLPYCQVLPMVHAYPPWAYVFMVPFAQLDSGMGAVGYRILQEGCLLGVFAFALIRLERQSVSWWWPCVGFAVLCLAASAGFTRCLIVGNYGIVSTAAAFAALWLHERGRDELAGLCWFLVLLKPQLGGLFLLTLLLEQKWRTLLITGFVLASATLCVAVLCGRNPVSMILCVGECSRGQFPGLGFVPVWAFEAGVRLMGEQSLLVCSAIAGCIGCVVSWWLVRCHPSVWVRFLPAAVLSVVWTTWRLHDFSMHLLIEFILLISMWHAHGVFLVLLISLGAAVSVRSLLIANITWLVRCNYVTMMLLLLVSVLIAQRCFQNRLRNR